MKTVVQYVVSCRLYPVKAFDGKALTDDDDIGYLGFSDGYPQISRYEYLMSEKVYIQNKEKWQAWDGMPWYCHMKPNSIKVTKITTTTSDPEVVKEDWTDYDKD